MFNQLISVVRSGQSVQVITLLEASPDRAECVGQVLAVYGDITLGHIVDEDITEFIIHNITGQSWQGPCILEIEHKGRFRLFWDCWQARPSALILGGGHISQPLAQMLEVTGFQVTVVDDRTDFANAVRFPKAQIFCGCFADILQQLELSKYQAVIIVTRGHQHDLNCLRILVGQELKYLGMIGSLRRIAGIRQLLVEEGADIGRLQLLRAPIGLDIGAQTPAETALSITAEVIAALRGGDCLPLSFRKKGV